MSSLSEATAGAQQRNGNKSSDTPKPGRIVWAALAPNGDISTFTSREDALAFAVPEDRVVKTEHGKPLPKAWFAQAAKSTGS